MCVATRQTYIPSLIHISKHGKKQSGKYGGRDRWISPLHNKNIFFQMGVGKREFIRSSQWIFNYKRQTDDGWTPRYRISGELKFNLLWLWNMSKWPDSNQMRTRCVLPPDKRIYQVWCISQSMVRNSPENTEGGTDGYRHYIIRTFFFLWKYENMNSSDLPYDLWEST